MRAGVRGRRALLVGEQRPGPALQPHLLPSLARPADAQGAPGVMVDAAAARRVRVHEVHVRFRVAVQLVRVGGDPGTRHVKAPWRDGSNAVVAFTRRRPVDAVRPSPSAGPCAESTAAFPRTVKAVRTVSRPSHAS